VEKIEIEASQLAADAAEFAEIVEPLERLSGKLNGPGRSDCIRAFAENRAGFRVCATQALATSLRRGYHSPLGLLVKMVREGQHEVSASGGTANGRRPPCPECERGGGYHLPDCSLDPGSRNRQESAE
jgi:hypothetical protein